MFEIILSIFDFIVGLVLGFYGHRFYVKSKDVKKIVCLPEEEFQKLKKNSLIEDKTLYMTNEVKKK